jgi:hypothetical protein
MLWRSYAGRGGGLSRCNIFRPHRDNGRVNQRFGARDIEDLAKLTQLIAFAVSEDGRLDSDLRDDLSCLAACLGDVLGRDKPPRVFILKARTEMCGFLKDIINHCWEDVEREFEEVPSAWHVYRRLVLLDRWLAGVVRDEEELGTTDVVPFLDYFGGCPICGKHNGCLNVQQACWFVCYRHQTRWLASSTPLPTDRRDIRDQRAVNMARIQSYLIVQPWRPLIAVTATSD